MSLNPNYIGKLVYYDAYVTMGIEDPQNWIPGIIVKVTANNQWYISWLHGSFLDAHWNCEQAERGYFSMYQRKCPYVD